MHTEREREREMPREREVSKERERGRDVKRERERCQESERERERARAHTESQLVCASYWNSMRAHECQPKKAGKSVTHVLLILVASLLIGRALKEKEKETWRFF